MPVVQSMVVSTMNQAQAQQQQVLLTSMRAVELHFSAKQQKPSPLAIDNNASFAAYLQRKNGINLYGRPIVHEENDAKFASLCIFDNDDEKVEEEDSGGDDNNNGHANWDATLLLTPSPEEPNNNKGIHKKHSSIGRNNKDDASLFSSSTSSSCFIAMNRFPVKTDCRYEFEQRWATRTSQLSHQPGFVAFCLLRKRIMAEAKTTTTTTPTPTLPEDDNEEKYNYASCTIWTSHDSWLQWRNGDGRFSHVRPTGEQQEQQQQEKKRTPTSDWLSGPASPIFWEGS